LNLADLLAQAGGLQSIARDLDIDESQAVQGAEALLPAILGGFRKQAQSTGIEGLGGLLGQLGGGGLLDQVLAPQKTDVSQGNEVLGQIFGSRDVSRAVAQNASAQSGLDAGLLKKMLPLLALAVTGYLAKQGSAAAPAGGLGGLGGMLGGLLGGKGGGLAAILDANGDGNALDDVMRMLKR
jgi:hypothetical protein